MQRGSELGSLVLLAALLLVLSFPTFAQAQEAGRQEITPRLFCETTDFGNGEYWSDLVRVRPDGIERHLVFRRWLRNSRQRLIRLRTLRRAASNRATKRRLGRRIQRQRAIRMDVISCRNGELSIPDGGNDGGGGSGGGSSSPGANALPCDVIGDQSSSGQVAKIINGKECEIGNSATVEVAMDDGWSGSCTGNVITKRRVLTAAHCVADENGLVDKVDIIVGDDQWITASSFVVHPSNPEGDAGPFDIAILKFNQDIPTQLMKIIDASAQFQVGETMIIGGYGYIGEGQNSGKTNGLQASKMKLFAATTEEIIAEFDHFGDGPAWGNTCMGDSGGPLKLFRNEKWVLAGVTSYGHVQQCGPTDTSGFVNLASPSNRAFIEQHAPGAF